MTKEESKTIEIEPKGSLVEITKEATNNLYKGYMYANSNDETIFSENNTIKISKASEIETIEINNQNEMFIDKNEQTYDATSSMTYKSTKVNKNDLQRIFGKAYELKILDNQNNEIANITDTAECEDRKSVV